MIDIQEAARAWVEGDPDPQTADALSRMIEDEDTDALRQAMGGVLEFGTAGIRGVVGPGSNQMNRAVVIKTTRGLVDFLFFRHAGVPPAPVIVGFDARLSSRDFAEDTVGVLAAADIGVDYFREPTPTPLVAYAAKLLNASAAVVVTASHNPPADNGYKVYDSNAAQIIPPTDDQIAQAIKSTGPANRIPRLEHAFSTEHPLLSTVPDSIIDDYWAEVTTYRSVLPSRTVKIVYTPLHGVGGSTITDIFARTVHDDVTPVPEQFAPDGTFPTLAFPNPEEPGALDLAMKTGDEIGADLILANDPDADRLAAAIRGNDGWRLFTGNELGVILGSHLLETWRGPARPITANSVVSSPMLSLISAEHGGRHLTTLTGFKWIVNAALAGEEAGEGEFLFGFEEALGYSVGRTVRDKDGISAAVLLADIAALLAGQGRTLLDRLSDLWRPYGIWVSTQQSISRPGENGQQEILTAVDALASSPPTRVADLDITSVQDYREGADRRPPWLGSQALIELELGKMGRILTRPSGTEPKLKIYVDLREDTTPPDVHRQRDQLLVKADLIASEMASYLTKD